MRQIAMRNFCDIRSDSFTFYRSYESQGSWAYNKSCFFETIHCAIVSSPLPSQKKSFHSTKMFINSTLSATPSRDNKLGSSSDSSLMIIVRKASINCLIAICIPLCMRCQCLLRCSKALCEAKWKEKKRVEEISLIIFHLAAASAIARWCQSHNVN